MINFMVNTVTSTEIMTTLAWWEFTWKLCGRRLNPVCKPRQVSTTNNGGSTDVVVATPTTAPTRLRMAPELSTGTTTSGTMTRNRTYVVCVGMLPLPSLMAPPLKTFLGTLEKKTPIGAVAYTSRELNTVAKDIRLIK